MMARYRWVITEDLIDGGKALGLQGPENLNVDLTGNRDTFELYDDDGILYARGSIYGDYDGFEPLDDYGTPGWGCTGIKYGGKWL